MIRLNPDDMLLIGLIINFIGIIFVIVNSKIKLERRLSILETKVIILMRASDIQNRRSTDKIE